MRRAPVVLVLAFLALVLTAGPAAAAPGDTSQLKNRGGQIVVGKEIDDNGDGKTDGLDIDGDGKWDVADTDGDGVIDKSQGVVTGGDTDPVCGAGDLGCAAGAVVSNAADDALDNLARKVSDADGAIVKSVSTMWVKIGTPQLADGSVVEWLRGQLALYTGAAATIAVMIGCAKTALSHRAAPAKETGSGLVTLVIVNSMSLAGIAAAVAMGDAFANYIIDQSTTGIDFGTNMAKLFALSATIPGGPVVLIVLGVVAFFTNLAQLALMLARGGLIVVLAGVLPLASSFANTEAGRSWHRKILGLTVAAILYKPAAAIIYAAAFRLTGQDLSGSDGITNAVIGLMLQVMAVFSIVTLAAAAIPAAAAGGSRGGGSGAALLGAGVATGAQVVSFRGGPSGGAAGASSPGSSGSAGPSGASNPGPGAPGASGAGGPRGGGSPGPSGAGGGAGAAGASGASGAAGGAAGAGAGAATGGVGTAVVAAGQAAAGAVRNTASSATGTNDPGGNTP